MVSLLWFPFPRPSKHEIYCSFVSLGHGSEILLIVIRVLGWMFSIFAATDCQGPFVDLAQWSRYEVSKTRMATLLKFRNRLYCGSFRSAIYPNSQ